jgi:hypothetical protein
LRIKTLKPLEQQNIVPIEIPTNDLSLTTDDFYPGIKKSMSEQVNLHFRKPPPLYSNLLSILLTTVFRKKRGRPEVIAAPDVAAKSSEFPIPAIHQESFCKMCGINGSSATSLIYPMTLTFPFFQRLLGLKQAPLPVYNVLAKHLNIEQHQPILPNHFIAVLCRYEQLRIVPNGLELDISATIKRKGISVWKAVETFFYRGNFGNATDASSHERFFPIIDPHHNARWELPSGNGFRFARLCGDGNPMHYIKRYARRFGYTRDFAQPLLVLGRAVQELSITGDQPHLIFNVAFKGPCYYENDIIMNTRTDADTQRFDIYSDGNPRPCMAGSLD